MRPRRQAAQHVKLNILSKSQLINLNKDGNSFSFRNRESFNRGFTLPEQANCSESKSAQSSSQGSSQYSPIENVQVSQFTYSKLSLIEKHLFFSTITMFFFGFLLVEVESQANQSQAQYSLLLLLSFCSVLQVILTIVRKLLVIQLKIDQKVMYHYNNRKATERFGAAVAALISNNYLLVQLCLEVAIALVHPNLITKGMTYTLHDQEYDMKLTLSINDLFGVLMLLKLAIIIRSLVNLTKFVTPRVVRVCNLNQVDYNLMYSIKCIQKQYPIRFVLIAVTLILSTFGYGFRFAEGNVINYNQTTKNGFEELPNCLWFAFQTMYTIGYGEYIPRTLIGRFLAACLSVMGVGINSMLLVSVFDYISMSNQEQKSLTLIHRMNNRIQMQRHAACAIAHIAEVSQLIQSNKSIPSKLEILASYYKNVKLHMDQSKQYRLNIKNLIPLNDQTQTMIHQFSNLRESFSEVCRNQVSVLKLLQNDKYGTFKIKRSIGEHFKSFIRKTLTRSPSMSVVQG